MRSLYRGDTTQRGIAKECASRKVVVHAAKRAAMFVRGVASVSVCVSSEDQGNASDVAATSHGGPSLARASSGKGRARRHGCRIASGARRAFLAFDRRAPGGCFRPSHHHHTAHVQLSTPAAWRKTAAEAFERRLRGLGRYPCRSQTATRALRALLRSRRIHANHPTATAAPCIVRRQHRDIQPMNKNTPNAPMIDLDVQPIGKLRHGLKIGDNIHTEYEFATDITAADYFAAEDDAGGRTSLRFDAALVARQLKRIGTFDGPFSATLLGKLKPNDMARLIRVREALEAKGNAEPSGDPSS